MKYTIDRPSILRSTLLQGFVAIAYSSVMFSLGAHAKEFTVGEQTEQEFTASDGTIVKYLLHIPGDYDANKPTALLLFLHGRGESHGPISLVAKWGPPRMAERGDELPYIIVSPQCPGDDRWTSDQQQKRVLELLDAIEKELTVDSSRVYLTGLSMGGYGSWRMAAENSDRFAAAIIVCGQGKPEYAEKLVDMPIWAWHGDQDTAVPFRGSVEMCDAIEAAGGQKIRFTALEHIGHNSWSAAYASEDTWQWLNEQSRE